MYQDALDYLFKQLPMFQRQGKKAFKPGLDNIKKIDAFLRHPHLNYPSIHIAGTNGKGSTAHILASILQAAGLKVGLYTSPHYKDYRERIKINGELIKKEFVVDFVNKVKAQAENIQPSYFEFSVAMAFEYFAVEQVDIAVIETGLGGIFDSTNIVDPIISVITNISYDHMEILGDTLPKIAVSKAGIIK
ncbi:MAG: Mur ligase family protein, partial [Bacteroidota bacterium]